MMYDVSVILINFNSSKYTLQCVESILSYTNKEFNFNITIVDNASKQNDFEKIKSLSNNDRVSIVRSKINLGFAGGNMFATQFTQAKYYFFLNNDCVFLNDVITELFSFCEQKKEVGMCSPQLYSEDKKPIPSFDYFPIISSKIFGNGIFRLIKGKEYRYRKDIYTEPVKVDVISGSQMFIRASCFNELGGLDTNFFLYCEEEDFSIRLNRLGFDTYVIPSAKNIHHGNGSTNRDMLIRKEFYISFLYLYRKHYGLVKTELLRMILLIRLFKKIFFNMDNLKLFLFVLGSANLSNSLRHKQKIVEIEEA